MMTDGDAIPSPAPETDLSEPATHEDSLGRRVAAGLIDIVLLTGVAFIIGLATGRDGSSEGNSGIKLTLGDTTVTVTGVWLLLYLALVLVYYFAFEARGGQTPGKRLLGLRVTRIDGSRPSTLAIAERTVLRIIDWLPGIYLVGFVSMLAGGPPRRRLGDRAARTVVSRARPAPRRMPALVVPAVVLLALGGMLAYRANTADSTPTYRGHGVSFEYPGSWRELDTVDQQSAGGAEKLWGAAVGPGGTNLVGIDAYRMATAVTAENIGEAEAELESLLRRSYEQEFGGAIQSGPDRIMVAGMPGIRMRSTITHNGVAIKKSDQFFFDGTVEFHLSCQADEEHAANIDSGCLQILASFALTGA